MKSLFEDTKYSAEALEVQAQIERAITPILSNWERKGFSLRELELIAVHSVTYQVAMLALYKQHKEAKRGQEK